MENMIIIHYVCVWDCQKLKKKDKTDCPQYHNNKSQVTRKKEVAEGLCLFYK